MKQVLQDLSNGETLVEDLPAPAPRPGHLLIRTSASVVSAGTERMLVEFGKASYLDKARQQPDKVRQVLDKIRTDGLGPTVRAVRSQLDRPLPLGYSNAGVVLEVGAGVTGFVAGDRVASNGRHAEIVCVPANLCARIPADVSDETASFTVLGAIALQGVRLIAPTLGETVVVTGLGLIGLLAVQILRANGCRVLGIDLDPARAAIARQYGAETCVPSAGEDALAAAARLSDGRGVDAVLIAVASTSDEPMHQAAQMCRQRGRIVLVGVTGLGLARADFYARELSFQVSCSYGPGRYDPGYEEGGHDYPFGLVRWTEQRNFEAVLELMAAGQLDTTALVTRRCPIGDAASAYGELAGGSPLGIVLTYPGAVADAPLTRRIELAPAPAAASGQACLSVIGAGNYASQILLPALRAGGAALRVLVSEGGVSAVHGARRQGFAAAASDPAEALRDAGSNAVVIATRHDSHARYVVAALAERKHVFVEKPLAIHRDEIATITAAVAAARAGGFEPIVMTAFNRRFAPQVVRMQALLAARAAPKCLVLTVNAGEIPAAHWTQDRNIGGGRIVGEGCHFIDLLRFLAGSAITRIDAHRIGAHPGLAVREDKVTLVLEFADGSLGTIHYFANGHRALPKERLEVFCGGGVLQLDNFRRLRGYGWPGFTRMNLWRQDKGNAACAAAFVAAVAAGAPSPVPLETAIEVTRASFDARDALDAGR
ncbi:MAG: dehydrogenase [Gammaproteobacteria bacterium]|nr:MAG: dehydrogenase [Gammaproteobacteria bacterium]